jgi:NAD(P)-dependent dehydrogenase (short-subunit alcohol dehydrogenase family)
MGARHGVGIGLLYRPARLHRLAEFIPWNRFRGPIHVQKYQLCTAWLNPGALSLPQGWNAVIETNLTGTFLMSREVYRQHFGQHGGAIVNIIADMFRGFPLMAHTG